MPSKKKKYNARFPAGRIKKIMQTDEEVGKVAQAVPVIISRTLELFVESLLAKSLEVTVKRSAKTLTPSHVKHCILSESRFDFLKDLVANIPDISNVEEPQNLSADNSPTNNRFLDISANPGPSTVCRRPRQAHNKKDNNGQSSDSGSDHEPAAKRLARNPLGNGRHPKPTPNFDEDLKIFMQRKKSVTQTPEPSPSFAVPTVLNATTSSTDNKQRLFNFYTETLPDTSEEEDKNANKPAYSSVIQPNPEYNKSFGFYKPVGTSQEGVENPFQFPKSIVPAPSSIKAAEIVPKIHIDLTNGYPITLNAPMPGQPTPSYHLDFSAMPIPSPFGGRKAPPPLQTIKRSTSLPEPSSSSSPLTERIPKSSGLGKSRVDRSSLSFDSPGSSSGSSSRSKPEPPLLLPINLVTKSKCPPVLEIDEDYDT